MDDGGGRATGAIKETFGGSVMNRKAVGALVAVAVVLTVGAGAAVAWFAFMGPTPEEAMAAVSENMDTLDSYGFKMNMSIETVGETVDIDFGGVATNVGSVADTELKMDGTMTLMGQTIGMSEVMSGGSMYLKYDPNPFGAAGQWYSMALDLSGVKTIDPTSNPSGYLEYMKAYSTVEEVGTEEIDGEKCRHYHLVIDGDKVAEMAAANAEALSGQLPDGVMPGAQELRDLYSDATITMELYVGKDDNMPHRQELTIGLKNVQPINATITMDLFDFNIPVTIEVPAGAVPLPSQAPGTGA